MEKNLALTGMMGVGKTTIGKRLAKKLNYAFVDIDKIIEKQEGESISSIFKNKGEDYFRKLETQQTLKELKKDKSVISLGGGAFLNSTIRQCSKKHFFGRNQVAIIFLGRLVPQLRSLGGPRHFFF